MEELFKVRSGAVYTFGIPLIGLHKGHFKHFLVNAFLGDKRLGSSEYDRNHIFVLLKFEDSKAFQNVETFLESLGHFKASYDVLNGTYIMYVFRVFPEMQEDYEHFIAGRYSKLSEDYRSLLKLHVNSHAKVMGILNKDPLLKQQIEERIGSYIGDQEIYSIPEDFPYSYLTEEYLQQLASHTHKI
jgi:hypothetical protein